MITSSIGKEQYKVTHSNGRYEFFADEPEDKGGKDTAPSPDELLEAALASCISDDQKHRLIQVAKACPVSKTISGNAELVVEIN